MRKSFWATKKTLIEVKTRQKKVKVGFTQKDGKKLYFDGIKVVAEDRPTLTEWLEKEITNNEDMGNMYFNLWKKIKSGEFRGL